MQNLETVRLVVACGAAVDVWLAIFWLAALALAPGPVSASSCRRRCLPYNQPSAHPICCFCSDTVTRRPDFRGGESDGAYSNRRHITTAVHGTTPYAGCLDRSRSSPHGCLSETGSACIWLRLKFPPHKRLTDTPKYASIRRVDAPKPAALDLRSIQPAGYVSADGPFAAASSTGIRGSRNLVSDRQHARPLVPISTLRRSRRGYHGHHSTYRDQEVDCPSGRACGLRVHTYIVYAVTGEQAGRAQNRHGMRT